MFSSNLFHSGNGEACCHLKWSNHLSLWNKERVSNVGDVQALALILLFIMHCAFRPPPSNPLLKSQITKKSWLLLTSVWGMPALVEARRAATVIGETGKKIRRGPWDAWRLWSWWLILFFANIALLSHLNFFSQHFHGLDHVNNIFSESIPSAHHRSVMRKSKMSLNEGDDVHTTLTLMVDYDNVARTNRKIVMRNISHRQQNTLL